ncbi:MAG: hypothetical protein ACJ71J_17070 [Nitrososphaeraceae archaeon]|jgi:hypothetical protein
MQLITSLIVILWMAELGLVDYFVMGEAVGIVATLFVAFYFSRKQMQKLSIDIETKVLSDLDEKMHSLTQMAVERPQLIRIVSNVESDLTEEIAFTYHLLHTFAHTYHMYQRKVVSDNEWTGWLRMMRSCFEQGKVREYWEGGLELEKWFDPAFEDFINNEVVRKTSPKQKI